MVALSGWRGRPGRLPGRPPLRAFLLGLATGVVYFVGTLYWTGTVIRTFGGIPTVAAIAGVILLAFYQGAFPAVGALLGARLIARAGVAGILLVPAAWVSSEFFRGVAFGGFPWVPLGASQVTVLPVAQLASVLGVFGVSMLVALVNGIIAFALLTSGRARVVSLAAGITLLAATGVWGALRVADGSLTRAGSPVRVGLIQGNIAQEDKWKADEARRIFTTYMAMTRDAVGRGAEWVIWPESSTPFRFEDDPEGQATLRALTRELHVPLLFGSDQQEYGAADSVRLYNAAFMLSPEGATAAVYRKIHLVPWGEFIPLKRWLYFVSPIVDTLTDFSPGTSVVMLPVGRHVVSTAICYEVIFPSLMRQAVQGGSELLTTITNDAWYGNSSAPYQHFQLASMRAIEQGRYLARAANTGITGVVDPYGRVVQQTTLFEPAVVVEEVRFLTDRTIYSRIGDVVAYAAMALVAVSLIVIRPRR